MNSDVKTVTKRQTRWTEAEDALLRDLASKLSRAALSARLGRTQSAIEKRASYLKVKLSANKRFRYLVE
jgi:hypothetical protein